MTPQYVINNFNKKILFSSIKDKKFLSMLYNGNKPQTQLQKIFVAEYSDFLLNKNLKYLLNIVKSKHPKKHKQCLKKIIQEFQKYDFFDTKFLEKKINIKNNEINTLKKILIKILKYFRKCKSLNTNDKNLITIIKKIKNGFFDVEISLPQQHFYTATLGNSFGRGCIKKVTTNINNIFLLHPIAGLAQKKTEYRKNLTIVLLKKCIKHLGSDLSKYTINYLIKKFENNFTKSPLFSSSNPLSISYPKSDGTYYKNYYILVEGNGRLAALKSAYYELSKIYPDFIPPKLLIQNSKINSKIAIKNQYYFLILLWANVLPKNEIKGFKNQLQKGSLYRLNQSTVEKYPFNYGFVPQNIHIPKLNFTFGVKKKSKRKRSKRKRSKRTRKRRRHQS